jgi:dipeptidyl aminopeptidase/acylaminoacyl peptidase
MRRGGAVFIGLAGAILTLALAGAPEAGHAAPPRSEKIGQVRVWTINYRAHTGAAVRAYVALPASYGPRNNPKIPLIISPHGRGLGARANLRLFGALPARGAFAVVSPEGTGRRLARYSWGSPGQVEDLARMPEILRRTLPWLEIDRTRVFAFGGSMGGQEALLLLARHHRMLAGVAAFDAVANFALQYHSFPSIPCARACRKTWNGTIGRSLQALARDEVGGPPTKRRQAYMLRSPLSYARAIAGSCVPVQLWWSTNDRIVPNQQRQSGALYKAIRTINRRAPVQAFVGAWKHSAEMRAKTRLPGALAAFGLLPAIPSATFGLRVSPLPDDTCTPG